MNTNFFSKMMIGLCLVAILYSCGSGKQKPKKINGISDTCVKVVDGKTLELQNGLKVQLLGIKEGNLSKDWLQQEVVGKKVTIITDSKDTKQTFTNYHTTVRGYVLVEGDRRGSVNGLLLRTRKAELDQTKCKDSLDLFKRVEILHPNLNETELFAHLRPATFLIAATDGGRTWTGTGFFINDNGLALTNNHVLPEDVTEACIYYYQPDGHIDANNYRTISRIISSWNHGNFDVTIFKVNIDADEKVAYLPLIEHQETLGAKLYKLGNPEGNTCNFQSGNLSQYHNDYGYLTHSCPSNHGDSGGPVVNQRGEVVGINQSIDLNDSFNHVSQTHGVANAVDVTLIASYLKQKGIEYGR